MNTKRCLLFAKKGFTLIELMIVVGIIGLILTVAVVNYNKMVMKARDVKRADDLLQLATALEMYYDDHKAYPLGTSSTGTGDWDEPFKTDLGGYMSPLPLDPLKNSSLPGGGGRYYGAGRMTWASDAACNGRYVLWCYLEDSNGPNWGKRSCGFGNNHYFILLGKF